MNAYEKIKLIAGEAGLAAFMDSFIPDQHPEVGNPDKWLTYNVADERGALFAGDLAQENIISVQVHLFMPAKENYLALRSMIRRRLSEEGFTWPVITITTDEDHRIRHIIFECEIEEEE